MIGKLTGAVDCFVEDGLILDVGGVGYLVYASARTLGRLPGPGGRASLLVETHVREDHIHLYGFADAAERDWFRLLSTVQGVGVRHALALLSAFAPGELAQAVAAQDRTALTRASGVGPKLAGRIVAELKDKLGAVALGPGAALDGVPAAAAGAAAAEPANQANEDAVSALTNLGYRRLDAFSAVTAASRRLDSEAPLEALIREGLKELAS